MLLNFINTVSKTQDEMLISFVQAEEGDVALVTVEVGVHRNKLSCCIMMHSEALEQALLTNILVCTTRW